MRKFVMIGVFLAVSACADYDNDSHDGYSLERAEPSYDEFLVDLAETLKSKPSDYARAYAIIKDGIAGPDWLISVHGLSDNRAACEKIIEPYNSDPELTVIPGTYRCVAIDSDFLSSFSRHSGNTR